MMPVAQRSQPWRLRIFTCVALLAAALAGGAAAADRPSLRHVQTNGIRMRIAEMGSGPLVLLLHGWPESWYSWRHQMPALARAGFHVVAPDLRGYGGSDAPAAVEDYDVATLTADITGLLDALGEKQATLVGHDWGAGVAWACLLLRPERFGAAAMLSVPYGGSFPVPPSAQLKQVHGDNFFYVLYLQEPGVAEREFDADPRALLSRLYVSPDAEREAPAVTDPRRVAGGMVARMGAPKRPQAWLTPADLDYYAAEFRRAGFRGGLNYYRNIDRDGEIFARLPNAQVQQPVLFMGGAQDPLLRGATADQLRAMMARSVPGLRGVTLYAGAGHWLQQERPEAVNQALIDFLKALPAPAAEERAGD